MKISLNLLKNYIDINDLSISDIKNILTLAGIEVDSIQNITPPFSNVVSSIIKEVSDHPKSDHLKIAEVFDGENTYQIVCGAPNCRKGINVALARENAYIGKIKIKKTKIRGMESFGMLCSKKELNIGLEQDKIIELPEDMKPGVDLKILSSPILEISLTPNLGYCMSYIGIARELSALTDKKVIYPKSDIKKDFTKYIKIDLKTDLCKRYSSSIIENVEIKESPIWLKDYLEKSDIRPINNIVDVLNFVMIEYNQPMHAFDFDKIEKIEVDTLKEEKEFISLDETKRYIPKDSIVIKDQKEILAIAGIIGGKESSIKENTKNILLESAFFDPISIRKTSKKLNLRTESSIRFEKGLDPNKTIDALNRACILIKKLNPNCKISENIDVKKEEFPRKKIVCRISRTNKILGTNLSFNEIETIFQKLECDTKKIKEDSLHVFPPTYRSDIKEEIDLIEEVARIYGYHNIEKKYPYFTSSKLPIDPFYIFEKRLKTILISLNMQEVITCDLISPNFFQTIENKPFPPTSKIEALHSKSNEHSILRPSFLPSFLQVIKHNTYHKNFDISIFEIGNIHIKKEKEYFEYPTLSIMLSGKSRPYNIDQKPLDVDFFDLKGILENIFDRLKIKNYLFQKSKILSFHPGRQAKIFIDQIEIGILGETHPSLLKKFDIKQRTLFAEINLEKLFKNTKKDIKYKEIYPFPSTSRDLTIILDEDATYFSIFEKIKKIKSNLLEKVFLLDIFKCPKTPNKKNITLRFIYRDPLKTIIFEEAEKEHKKIIKKINE